MALSTVQTEVLTKDITQTETECMFGTCMPNNPDQVMGGKFTLEVVSNDRNIVYGRATAQIY